IAVTNNLTKNTPSTDRSQGFTYDALNRIATAGTVSTSGANCWGEQYGYDAWGNLLSIAGITPQYTGCTQESGFTNTMTGNNQIAGFCYDAAGNLLAQSKPPCLSPSYAYNAENQLKSTAGVTYTYDGDGKRVEKSNGKLYWYGMNADALDETDASGNLTDEYIFFGGKRIARRDSLGNVDYYFADHLGTARVVTNATGTIQDDSDFYPFGGLRALRAMSGNTYKVTGKERDAESGLDEFGARYYSSQYGRFMTPDWSAKPMGVPYAQLGDPQSLNLYSYVVNNPLAKADPDGHCSLCAVIQALIGEGMDSSDALNAANNMASAQKQNPMSLSSKGLNFIKGYEKLSLKPYKDQAGYVTVGYGHKILPGEDFSKGVTETQAVGLLNQDVKDAAGEVNAALKVSVTQNQFDALTSLAFNAGPASVAPGNEMMRAVNAGDVAEANFTAYRFIHVDGKAVVSQGLLNRRKAEYQMFSEGDQ